MDLILDVMLLGLIFREKKGWKDKSQLGRKRNR